MTQMYKVRTVVTGVAGAPYYVNHYFRASASDPAAVQEASHVFLTDDNAGTIAAGAEYRTLGEVQEIDSVTGDVTGIIFLNDNLTIGTLAGDLVPTSNQLLIRWSTSGVVAGRNVKGRTNIPARFEFDNGAQGRVTPATVTAITNKALDFISKADVTMVIYSPKAGECFDVVNASCWSEWAVLRSRRG